MGVRESRIMDQAHSGPDQGGKGFHLRRRKAWSIMAFRPRAARSPRPSARPSLRFRLSVVNDIDSSFSVVTSLAGLILWIAKFRQVKIATTSLCQGEDHLSRCPSRIPGPRAHAEAGVAVASHVVRSRRTSARRLLAIVLGKRGLPSWNKSSASWRHACTCRPRRRGCSSPTSRT